MSFVLGNLVKARGREWTVTSHNPPWVHLRPMSGQNIETTVVNTNLESIESANFSMPSENDIWDKGALRLLREAARFKFSEGAGPFRSFASLEVEPRSYQLVPLLMALKLDPVRLLIADDVGIGKTVEALLVAKELLARQEANGLTVLCPPHLAEQWQKEMHEKFNIDAELVKRDTVSKLEKRMVHRLGESIFTQFPFTVVSLDYIKSEVRRAEFIRNCPDLVIVDEAHTCAGASSDQGHQKRDLVKELSQDRSRHLLLVTATPHSGKTESFQNLVSFLNPEFSEIPNDLAGTENEQIRKRLARYFVQRRRPDIKKYLDQETIFPERLISDHAYSISEDYRKFFEKIRLFALDSIQQAGSRRDKRVRWWSALSLLRSVSSSPAAAVATLKNRSDLDSISDLQEIEQSGRELVLDLVDEQSLDGGDSAPGALLEASIENSDQYQNKLRALAKDAEKLSGQEDHKLKALIKFLKDQIKDQRRPIVFCSFIPTVDYLVEQLSGKIRNTEVQGITGTLPPEEREFRVEQLGAITEKVPVLICTDCLSEGINLQEHFDMVIHYDLSWNPTRHEQREGRVDRFGQVRKEVYAVTFYTRETLIDEHVLKVIHRKHRKIKEAIGVSVPVPQESEQVMESLLGEALKYDNYHVQLQLPFEEIEEAEKTLEEEWEKASEREKKSRSMFAQHALKPEEVQKTLLLMREALGSTMDLKFFFRSSLKNLGASIREDENHWELNLSECPPALIDRLGLESEQFNVVFDQLFVKQGIPLRRSHPLINSLASYILDGVLDPESLEKGSNHVASRVSIIQTSQVSHWTSLIVLRLRHLIQWKHSEKGKLNHLAEEAPILGIQFSQGGHEILNQDEAESLLDLSPERNIDKETQIIQFRRFLDRWQQVAPDIENWSAQRADQLLQLHLQVREAIEIRREGRVISDQTIQCQQPLDLLGVNIIMPL